MDHLIIKYLSKEISLEESHQLSKWLDEDEMNAKTLEKFQLYWDMSQQDFSKKREEVLSQIESEIKLLELQDPADIPEKPNRFINYLKYAAVLALVFLSAFLMNQFNTLFDTTENVLPAISYIEKISVAGQKITTTLPDGTSVKLNSGSKIIFPSRFIGDKRQVVLFGEAFFDVIRDESKPFVIKTANMSVHVLGTSFVVKTFSGGSDQFVAVKTGEVKVVNTATSDSVQLTQNLMAHLSERNEFSKISSIDENAVFGWMDQKLVFKDQTIAEVFEATEKWFGVEITNSHLIESKKSYTAMFDNPTIKEVMGSLSHMYQFKYEIDDKMILIEK